MLDSLVAHVKIPVSPEYSHDEYAVVHAVSDRYLVGMSWSLDEPIEDIEGQKETATLSAALAAMRAMVEFEIEKHNLLNSEIEKHDSIQALEEYED